MISLIVAKSENNVIGNKGRIPWYIPNDLKRFKKLTTGKGEWKSIDTANGTKHFLEFDATDIVMETLLEELEDCIESCKRYFNPNDEKYYNPDEYESELEAFEEYCEGCVDYPFTDYGHFLSFYREYLDERDELFNPSFDEYPDNKDIAEYFAEDVYGRI